MPASQGQAGLDADVDGVARIAVLQRIVEGHDMRVGCYKDTGQHGLALKARSALGMLAFEASQLLFT
jgi:hypothetical protein